MKLVVLQVTKITSNGEMGKGVLKALWSSGVQAMG
jgi:hypothetical protein